MAKRKKSQGSVPKVLARGPVWEGGCKSLGVPMTERDGSIVHPYGAFWVDAESGFIFTHDIFAIEETADGGITELVAALEKALAGGTHSPAIVRVREEKGAEAIRRSGLVPAALVEVARELPAWEAASDHMVSFTANQMPSQAPKPFAWKIDSPLLPHLYRLAAEYARREPWTFMPDSPPIAIELGDFGPRKNARTVYACVLGGGGELFGIAAYYSFAGYGRTVESGSDFGPDEEELREVFELAVKEHPELADVPPGRVQALLKAAADEMAMEPHMEDSMAVYFDPEEEHDPTYLEWLAARRLPTLSSEQIPMFFRARRSGTVGNLSAREVEAMALTLECVNVFVDRFRDDLEPDASHVLETTIGQLQLRTTYKEKPVRMWWPGDEYFLDPERVQDMQVEPWHP